MAFIGLRHIGLKFLSIALAALLWLLVSGEQIVERALRIPLEFTNLPAQLEIVGDAPNVVDVRVRGSSGALSRVSAGELVAVLDLRSARTGRRLFHLTGADVRAPFGVEVVQVMPASLSMTFEPSGGEDRAGRPGGRGRSGGRLSRGHRDGRPGHGRGRRSHQRARHPDGGDHRAGLGDRRVSAGR